MGKDTFIGVMVGLIVATFAGNVGLAIAQNLQPTPPTPTPTLETSPSPSPSPPPAMTPEKKPIPALW